MTLNSLVQLVTDVPEVRALWGENVQEMNDAVNRHATDIAGQVSTAFDWDFTTGATTKATVTDQAEYELKGESNDCRDIINVRYGASSGSLIVLDKMSPIDLDEFLSGRTVTGTGWWYISGRSANKYPKITLVNSPADATNTIYYRYRLKDIGVGSFPDEFSPVLVEGTISRFLPSHIGIYEHELNKMIDRYQAPGGEDSPARLGPRTLFTNNRVARSYGYSGGNRQWSE